MTNLELSKLLDRYINGECNDEEIAIINSWYADRESLPDYLNEISDDKQAGLRNRMLSHVLNNMAHGSSDSQAYTHEERIIPFFHKWWSRIAAAAVILVIVKLTFFTTINKNQLLSSSESPVEYTNNTHNIMKKMLPDGSVVWLKPHATLTVPTVFKKSSRNISMNGECFFEITKNPSCPFIISSAHIVTKVWGTSFKIVDYKTSIEAEVKVITGKVSVSKKNRNEKNVSAKLSPGEVILMPSQKAVYNHEKETIATDLKSNMQDMDQWKHINLSFENDKLSVIVKELNNKFNTNIQIKGSRLADEQMTADFSGLNLPEVLEVLKASMVIDYEIIGYRITLKKSIKQ